MSEAPKVYGAIAAVTRALGRKGLPKGQVNVEQGYRFRGIDEVYGALNPLLARHRLCMLPRMLERGQTSYRGAAGEMLFSVWVHAAFDFVSTLDGSRHTVETFGEAIDAGDKGTSKAMSAAFKYAAFQTFCVPVAGMEDADAHSPARIEHDHQLPPEGWEAWGAEIIAIVGACVSDEALDRVQNRHRQRLRLLSRTRSDLYARIGSAIQARRAGLAAPASRAAA